MCDETVLAILYSVYFLSRARVIILKIKTLCNEPNFSVVYMPLICRTINGNNPKSDQFSVPPPRWLD